MPAGEDGDQHFLDDPVLADDHLGQLGLKLAAGLRQIAGRVQVRLRRRRCRVGYRILTVPKADMSSSRTKAEG